MWNRRDIIRTGVATIVTVVLWVIVRLLDPSLDYFPPEILIRNLERSWFVTSELREPAMVVYVAIAIILLAVFFHAVQQRWPGRGVTKGLAFGASLGVIWSFGFLAGWAFQGTTLRAELLNGVLDLVGLALAGWLVGLAVGRYVPGSVHSLNKPWLAVLCVAVGFVSVHAVGARLLANVVSSTMDMLFVPATPRQIALLFGLGVWTGGMFVVLRAALPFNSTLARTAFFAFGIFGHSWTWFHVFNVIEFSGVLGTVLLVGLVGATGVFAGALAYEGIVARSRKVD